jgi:small conductance mechanosensitive channel
MKDEQIASEVTNAAEAVGQNGQSAAETLNEVLPNTDQAAQWIETIQEFAVEYGIKIVAAVLIFIIGRWIAGLVKRLIGRLMAKREVDETIAIFVSNIAYAALLIFVIIAAIGKLGIQTGSFIAIIGAAGLAIGLALQGSLANFAAGFLIILFRPFKKGDFIEAGGSAGIVEEIQVFTTLLKTPDNKVIIVPNSNVLGGNITNFTARDTRRVDFVFGVSYSDDLKEVREVIQAVISEDERIHKDPEPMIVVSELADSSVNFTVRVWANTSDYWGVFFDTTETMKVRFDAKGISIPFPQRDLHMVTEKAVA